jgi:CheY-like chemotaxis protein
MNAGGQVILIVEDDPNDVLLIQRAFDKARILNPLQTVGNGDDAVAYLAGEGSFADRQRHPFPVLVLLDLKLPRRSGLEVLEWIRGQVGLKRLPVVVLTSSKETTDVNQAYDLGANSYLVKPVGFDSLLELVKSLEVYWLILNQKPDVSAA